MTMNIMQDVQFGNIDYAHSGEIGEWFVATKALVDKPLEELGISLETGSTVLTTRRGFWNDDLNTYDVEVFLWGTPDELAQAQEKYKLQSSVDALLDQPEPYWG